MSAGSHAQSHPERLLNSRRNPCSICSGLSAQQGADSPEAAALDKRIERLQDKIIKVKHEYEDMLEQLNDLMEQRNPEKKEEAVKERLWQAYSHSTKSLDFIIDFIENAPDEDDYWNN